MRELTQWAVKELPRIPCFFLITPALLNTYMKRSISYGEKKIQIREN
jgi:hypothetical protein